MIGAISGLMQGILLIPLSRLDSVGIFVTSLLSGVVLWPIVGAIFKIDATGGWRSGAKGGAIVGAGYGLYLAVFRILSALRISGSESLSAFDFVTVPILFVVIWAVMWAVIGAVAGAVVKLYSDRRSRRTSA